jgi:hypothetical protein
VSSKRAEYGAQGGLSFLTPRFSRLAHGLVRAASGVYLRLGEGVHRVSVEGQQVLVEEFRRFFAGKSRLIIAFRHPSVSDAPLLTYLFARHLPRLARREGRPFHRRSHVHFLYGRGVPVWAGRAVGWLLPRVAAVPVYHRRLDSRGMAAVREAAVHGRFPLALAPEGQVSYHNKAMGDLEAGTGRIALWCRDDLRRAGRTEDVRILPLSLEYRFPDDGRSTLAEAVDWIGEKTGLRADLDAGGSPAAIRERLLELTGALLELIEQAYAALFRASPASGASAAAPRRRIEALCDTVLKVGEQVHELPAEGSLLDRVFRLRDAGWRRMFRDDLPGLSPVERSLADAAAEEAKIAARHMELVDVLEYVDPGYIPSGASLERLAEYAVDLQDVVNRLLGGTIAGRLRPRGRRALVTAGTPVSVDTFAEAAGPREAASRITSYIRAEFTRLMGS